MSTITADETYHNFSKRLNAAITSAGYRPGPTVVARNYNLRADGAAVTVHAVRKWLVGESFPTHEKMLILAAWLDVSPHWLRYGEISKKNNKEVSNMLMLPEEEIRLLKDFRFLHAGAKEVVRELVESLMRYQAKLNET